MASELFVCRKCGDCCHGYGGTHVTPKDMEAIAAYIDTDMETLQSRYCNRSGSRFVLAQKEDGYCIFWNKLCTIHPVKPRMCRAWPFIESVLTDVANWYAMAASCPGMNADASEADITAAVRQEILRRNASAG